MITPFLPSQLNIGSYSFTLYGLLIGTGFSIILYVIDKKYSNQIEVLDYIFLSFITLIGARLIYVLHNLTYMLNNPSDILKLWDGGIAIHGAIIGGIFAGFLISKWRNIKFTSLIDTSILYLPLAQAIGRWGNFFNQELYGQPCTHNTNLCLSIPIEKRLSGFKHYEAFVPTFFIESILNLLNFILLLWITKNKQLKSGIITAIYFINYGIIRLIMNRLRIDKDYLPFLEFLKLDTSDLLAVIGIIISILYIYKKKGNQMAPNLIKS